MSSLGAASAGSPACPAFLPVGSGRRPRRPASGLLLVALPLLLGACVASGNRAPQVVDAAAPARSADLRDDVFDVGYSKIAEVYFQPVDLGKLTVDGLSGLATIDKALSASRTDDYVQLVRDGAVVDSFRSPGPTDPEAWAGLTVSAIRSGQRVSAPLRDATSEQIYEAVFDGVIGDLDEYSRYVNAERAEQERASRDGYGGIGLVIDIDEAGQAHVDEVFPNSPASRAGIRAGDLILAVDGESTVGWDVDMLGHRLRGPISSTVEIVLQTPGTPSRTLDIEREHVIVDSVDTRIEDGVAIIHVARFNAATTEHVAAAIDRALDQLATGAVGLILDLRGNPGGLLDQSVAVADLFIPRGQIISTRGRHPDSMQFYTAARDDWARGLPVVVLVDGRSASGSEVVAAALQDSGRAVVVGSSSYGKGSVQTVTRLPNSGELFLTWSRIYGPSGFTIHKQGVLPTICTSNDEQDPANLINAFRIGHKNPPVDLSAWREVAADDAGALAILRGACPWREHDGDLDIRVAEQLLRDRTLYAQALSHLGSEALAQR